MAALPRLLARLHLAKPQYLPQPEHQRSESELDHRSAGLSLLEVMVSVVILMFGLVALGAVSLSTSHGNQQSAAASFMIDRAQTLIENIKGTAPSAIVATFDQTSLDVTASAADVGVWLENATLLVDVDPTVPTLLGVTVTCTWSVGTEPGTLTIRTEIYDPGGA